MRKLTLFTAMALSAASLGSQPMTADAAEAGRAVRADAYQNIIILQGNSLSDLQDTVDTLKKQFPFGVTDNCRPILPPCLPDGTFPNLPAPPSNGPNTDKPGTDNPGNGNPDSNLPGDDNPGVNNPDDNNPGDNNPGDNNPGGNPDIDKPDTDFPENDVPDGNYPDNNNPGGSPDANKPETDKPGNDIPDSNNPDSNNPGGSPDTDKPGNDSPGNDNSDGNTPGGNPGVDNPGSNPDGNPDGDKPGIDNPDSGESDDDQLTYAEQVVYLVNIERRNRGLSALSIQENVRAAAQVRAMEIQTSFSHTRPNGRSFSSALLEQNVVFRGSGENIAWGQKSPEEVVNGWMNSEGHRANILNPSFTAIGVGHYQNSADVNYWTQLFIY